MEKFKYQFNDSLRVLFKYYYGTITLEDIITSWEYAFENTLIPRETKGFLLDYSEATFNINIDEYLGIPDFYKKNLDVFGNLRIAVLTESPTDIVIPTLVESKNDGFCSKPFSTLEAAIKWVLTIGPCDAGRQSNF